MSLRRLPILTAIVLTALVLVSCTAPASHDAEAEAQAFLDLYASLFQGVYYAAAEAQWKASTDVNAFHDGQRAGAGKAYASVQGNSDAIRQAQKLLERRDQLKPITIRSLEALLLSAAEAPGTLPDVVARRVEAEGRQSSTLDGFTFCLEFDGQDCKTPTTANQIDSTLTSSRDPEERLHVWETSKQTGSALRDGLIELRDLRNQVAREMGFDSFYHLQVADYGMTVDEMQAMLQQWVDETRPLYEQLHCWAKYRLADRYDSPVPSMLPAHWIDNRWSQSWGGLVNSVDLDPLFEDKTPEWIVEQAERFYTSMEFPELPEIFWERSDLYPVPISERHKNTHASAWHLDLENDVRSLMSVEANARWFSTTHHELGHIYYYIAYTRPEVPLLLRGGANRGFHEGIGELISLASMQAPYLKEVGLLGADDEIDQQQWLLNEALSESIMFLPWAAGVMSFWEKELYADELPADQFNKRWWDYVARFQGVTPPNDRPADGCDACT
ncbi:MAG: M2 family metallopeptidase, partial [Acidobacteriota bacterium]|nr:M2 family metallopeptidase [Acidobacteriota bacterium]